MLAVYNYNERRVWEIHDSAAGIAYTIVRLKALGRTCYMAPRGNDVWMTIVHHDKYDASIKEFIETLAVWADRWHPPSKLEVARVHAAINALHDAKTLRERFAVIEKELAR